MKEKVQFKMVSPFIFEGKMVSPLYIVIHSINYLFVLSFAILKEPVT